MQAPTQALPRGLYWRGNVIWFRIQRNGKREFISLGTSDVDKAVELAADHKRTVSLDAATGETVDDLIPRFLSDKARDAGYSRSSHDWAEGALNRFAAWLGKLTPASVNEDRVKAYRTFLLMDEGLKPTSVNSYLRALGSFMTWAHEHGRCANKPPVMLLPRAKGHARTEFCTEKQRDKLIASAITPDLGLVLRLGFLAGLRRNEICEAAPDWIDMKAGTITVKERPEKGDVPAFRIKDRENRTIPLHPKLKEFLAEWPMDGAFLLQPTVKHGASKYRYDIRVPFEDYMTLQGLPWVTHHTMRRTFGSLLAQAGISLYKIAKWLGDTIETTEAHYAHLQAHDSDIAPELRKKKRRT